MMPKSKRRVSAKKSVAARVRWAKLRLDKLKFPHRGQDGKVMFHVRVRLPIRGRGSFIS